LFEPFNKFKYLTCDGTVLLSVPLKKMEYLNFANNKLKDLNIMVDLKNKKCAITGTGKGMVKQSLLRVKVNII
jgi:hypothetical protein